MKKYSYLNEKVNIVLFHEKKEIRIKSAKTFLKEMMEIERFGLIEKIYRESKDKKVKDMAKEALRNIAEENYKRNRVDYFTSIYLKGRERAKVAEKYIRICEENQRYDEIERVMKNTRDKRVEEMCKAILQKKAIRDYEIFKNDLIDENPFKFRGNLNIFRGKDKKKIGLK